MRPFTHIGKLFWRCGCLACHCLNFLLLFLAVAQLGAVFLNFFQKEIPLPDKLARMVVNQLGPEHIEASWTRAVFDLRAGLHLMDLVVRDKSSEQIIATAKEIQLQLAPLSLVFPGLPPVKDVNAQNVEIYIPASHSPSGLNESVLLIHQSSLHEQDGNLIVSSLFLQTGQIQVHFEGAAPLPLLRKPREATATGVGPTPRYLNILQSLSRIPPDMALQASVHWRLLPSGHHRLRVEGLLPELNLPQLKLEEIQVKAFLGWSAEMGLSLQTIEADGSLTEINRVPNLPVIGDFYPFDPLRFRLLGNGPQFAFKALKAPSRIQVQLHDPSLRLPIRNVLLNSILGESQPLVHWIANSPAFFAAGSAVHVPFDAIDPHPNLPLKLDFRLYLPFPALDDYLSNPPARLLQDTHADLLRLNASFDPERFSLQGNMNADGFFIGQTHFSRLNAQFLATRDVIDLPEILIRKAHNESATGSYFQHFPSSRFALTATGAIFPSSLNIILGNWWTRIFRDIQAPSPLPADVAVWGQWRDRTSLQSLTYADGDSAYYRGVEVPDLKIRVRSNHQWAYLEQLEATFDEGNIQGTIGIRSGVKPTDRLRAMVLDIESDAPWSVVQRASGIEELKLLSFSGGHPALEVRGVLWNDSGKGFKAKTQADLSLSLTQREGICRVQGLELEDITLSGELKEGTLSLVPLTGKFAEGVFTGSIKVENWQNGAKRRRHHVLELFDANYGQALEQLSSLMKNPETVRGSLVKNSQEGRLDAVTYLVTGAQPEESFGSGTVSLRQAKVGQIHIFGGLSKFLDNMGLGFSSLELNAMTLNWSLADGNLQISEGLFTGPVLSLAMGGSVDILQQELDMQADLTLFSGVISKMLSPVSETFQFDLTGSLESPNWKVRFKPFGWFQRRLSVPENRPGL